jgi:lysozyme
MGLDDAEEFVAHIFAATQRWPGLYGGSYLRELVSSAPDTVLAKCWLWFARYASTLRIPSQWERWTLWQYTDGAAGPEPRSVDGVGPCDRNLFNGSPAEFAEFWSGG